VHFSVSGLKVQRRGSVINPSSRPSVLSHAARVAFDSSSILSAVRKFSGFASIFW